MDPKIEELFCKNWKKMSRRPGCACIEDMRDKLELLSRKFFSSKPKEILLWIDNYDEDLCFELVINCKCFDKKADPNYVNPVTLRQLPFE